MEHSSVAEELLSEIPALELKCRAVEKSVKDGYFTLNEALTNYKVSEIEYLPYILLTNNKKIKRHKKQHQLFDTIKLIVSIFCESSQKFDAVELKATKKIIKIAEPLSSEYNFLLK